MNDLFLNVLNISIRSSYIFLLVIGARTVIKRSPKIYSYVLWILFFFTAMIPNIFPNIAIISRDVMESTLAVPSVQETTIISDPLVNENHNTVFHPVDIADNKTRKNISTSLPEQINMYSMMAKAWLAIVILFLIYSLVSYIILKFKLKKAVCLWDNIYESDKIGTPFVFGTFPPKIMIPATIAEEKREYIIAHEQLHIKRLDYLVKIFAYFITVIHWFNPVMWINYKLLVQDMEMSCDEKVLILYNDNIKKAYSLVLVELAESGHNFSSRLGFGESNVNKRVKHILAHKKVNRKVKILSVCILIISCLVFIILPKNDVISVAQSNDSRNLITAEDDITKDGISDVDIVEGEISDDDIAEDEISDDNIIKNNESIETGYDIISNHTDNVYKDIIGNLNIRMMINRKDNVLRAYYVTRTDNNEKTLNGIYNSKTRSFYLSNADGSIFLDGREKSIEGEGDLLIGTGSLDGKNEVQFKLAHTGGTEDSENQDKTYSYLGYEYDSLKIEALAETLKQYIRNNEKENLAEIVHYPLRVNLYGTSFLIDNEKEFIERYDDIFDQDLKDKILSAYSKYLGGNYMGIPFAEGSVWFYPYAPGNTYKINSVSIGAQPLPDDADEYGITNAQTTPAEQSEYAMKYPKDENGKYILTPEEYLETGLSIYMDEVSEETTRDFFWTQNFTGCDYDKDGLTDRVRLSRENRGTFYYVEFGNGDLLKLGPFLGYDLGFSLEGADFTGDGVPEMLFVGQHNQSTGGPWSEIIIAKKQDTVYENMIVPMPSKEYDQREYAVGYPLYVLEVGDDSITIGNNDFSLEGILKLDLKKTVDIPHYEGITLKELYTIIMNTKSVNSIIGASAWTAQVADYKEKKAVELQIKVSPEGSRTDPHNAVVTVIYEYNQWKPVNIRF